MGSESASHQRYSKRPIEDLSTDFGSLSKREEQVLSFAAAGYIDKEIGQQLGISVNTLRTYWQRIRFKIGEVPRSALAAAYVTHVAKVAEAEIVESTSADWEIDLVTDSFRFLSGRPNPGREFDGYSIEDLIRTYVAEEQVGLRKLIEEIRTGQRDEFYFVGRYVTSAGTQRSTAHVRVIKDDAGHPIKILGRRMPLIDLGDQATETYDWQLDLDSNMVTRLTEDWRLEPIKIGASITLEAALQQYHPDDQSRIRCLVIAARKGQIDSFSFYGRLLQPSGLVPTGSLALVERDSTGRPTRILGKRGLHFNFEGDNGLLVADATISRHFSEEVIRVNASFRMIFQFSPDERDVIGAITRRVIPEQANVFRQFIKNVFLAKIEESAGTFRFNSPSGEEFWVRLEFKLSSVDGHPSLLSGKAIAFR